MMKRIMTLTALAAVIGISSAAFADDGGEENGPKGNMPPGLKKQMHQKMLERFDADGDGELNDAEKEAMQAARAEMKARHEERRLKRFDKDGDGQLSDEEKAAAKAEFMKRVDTNGDGEISPEERKNAWKRRLQKRKKQGKDQENGPAEETEE